MLGSDLQLRLADLPGVILAAPAHGELDIGDQSAIFSFVSAFKPDWIINAAAATNVDECESNPRWAYRLNADAVGHLAAAARLFSARLLQFSTDYVFAGDNPQGYDENATPNPISVYGQSKLKGEMNALSVSPSNCVFRVCWLFGKARGNFVDFLKDMAAKNAEVTLIKDQYGHPSFTADLAEAIAAFIQTPEPQGGIYHLFNSGQTSRLEQGEYVFSLLGQRPTVHSVSVSAFSGKAPRPAYSLLKNSKLPPLRSWQEATRAYLETSL